MENRITLQRRMHSRKHNSIRWRCLPQDHRSANIDRIHGGKTEQTPQDDDGATMGKAKRSRSLSPKTRKKGSRTGTNSETGKARLEYELEKKHLRFRQDEKRMGKEAEKEKKNEREQGRKRNLAHSSKNAQKEKEAEKQRKKDEGKRKTDE